MVLANTLAGRYDFSLPQLAKALNMGAQAYEWVLEDLSDPDSIEAGSKSRQRWHDNFVLVAPSIAQARQWLPLLTLMGKAHQIYLVLRDHSSTHLVPSPPTVAQLRGGLMASEAAAPEGYTAIRVSAGKWVDVHRGVTAALMHCEVGRPGSVLRGLRVGITDPAHAAWAAGDPLARALSPDMLEPEEQDIFPVDLVIADSALEISSVRRPAGILVPDSGLMDHTGWSAALPPVDVRYLSPRGFDPHPASGLVRAEVAPDGALVLTDAGTGLPLCSLAAGEPLGENTIAALRPHNYVDVSAMLNAPEPRAAAVVLSGLATAGVPLLADREGEALHLLGDELKAAILAFDERDTALVRESKSINMRRLALGLFEPATRWGHWAQDAGLPPSPVPSISVVLATRRVDRVREAIRQIDRQSWPEVEIVLALHGIKLPPGELKRLREECSRNIVLRPVAAKKVLGEVLNVGVAAASGELIAKMDDDDWYGRHHLLDLMNARRYSGAVLLGSQVEFVYLEDLDIVTRRPSEGERYSSHVAGGTMLIARRDLNELGGWRPVHRAVDRCLLEAVEAAGGSMYRSHGQNYVMHRYSEAPGHGGHTWVPEMETFVQNSSEQWDGFALPPQIDADSISYRPRGRNGAMASIFSRPAPGLNTTIAARGERK